VDTLSVLLSRLGFSADIFFRGAFCGSNHFPVQPTRGHLHLLRQGSLSLTQDDGTLLQLEGPAVAWYPRPHAHGLSTGDGTAELLCASVHLASDDAMVRALPDCLHLHLAQLPALSGTLALLFEETRLDGPGHALVLKRLCEILVVQLLRHALQHKMISSTTLPGVFDAALGKAMHAMRAHPGGKWSVAELAAVCGMSRSRFARQFHEAAGCPPAQYLNRLRIARAQELLRQGRLVQDIAVEVGYSSQPAFTRAFRAATQLSPRDWLTRDGRGQPR
jgi:AraC-like DNA-binding protein